MQTHRLISIINPEAPAEHLNSSETSISSPPKRDTGKALYWLKASDAHLVFFFFFNVASNIKTHAITAHS